MAVTKKEVEHIASLARIELTEKEKGKMAKDMSLILDYVGKLNEFDTKNAEPTAQVTGLENVFRKDMPATDVSYARDNMINQFPHKKDDYLKVKEVFSEGE